MRSIAKRTYPQNISRKVLWITLLLGVAQNASANPCAGVSPKKIARGVHHWTLALTGAGLAGGARPLKSEVQTAAKRIGSIRCVEAVRQAAFAMGTSCAEGLVSAPTQERPDGWVQNLRGGERSCAKYLIRRCGEGLEEELLKPNAGKARKQVMSLPERCRSYVEGFTQACPPSAGEKRDPLDCLSSRLEAQAAALTAGAQ